MKRISIAMLMVFVIFGSSALAFAKSGEAMTSKAFEIDGSFGWATGPGDFDAGYGLNFGLGYTLGQVDKNLQLRFDLSYYDFSRDVFFESLDYKRVPFTVSARYYFPIVERLAAFAQAGIETSYDSRDEFDVFGNKHTNHEVNLGVTPGGGVEFFINDSASIFAVARWHLITDSYFSMLFGGAYHF
ncbi:MAG TPA: outer membrane beta-barrel protein [Nitrospirota bacterium]